MLAILLATSLGSLDEDLVKQHSMVFASYMNQDDDIDGFHQEDFEAELQQVQRDAEKLRVAGASQPTLQPLIEQALKNPESLGRITESIANLGAAGDETAKDLAHQIMREDPTVATGWERAAAEAMRLTLAERPAPGLDSWPPSDASWGSFAATAAARGLENSRSTSASSRAAPGFGFRAGGLTQSTTMRMRPDVDIAAHQLRGGYKRDDEL